MGGFFRSRLAFPFIVALGTAAGLPGPGVAADNPPLPQHGAAAHLGVETCAGSTCHGAVKPWQNSAVLQNEFITWERHDPHARAFRALTGERGRHIARNLGIADASKAKICLNCHADNVAPVLRAKNFRLSDGVGCEACHGGATNWLGLHVSGTGTRADNIGAGMFPTEDTKARARLCLSCHFGDGTKALTHRVMGAGHPRLSFELDTFTVSQPAHFRVDADYAQRKRVADGAQTWAVGQAMAAAATLEALLDPKRNRSGLFPELVYFDCQACHHPLTNIRWQPRESTGLGPGVPRLNDANLIMLRIAARATDPALAETLRRQTRALHQASQRDGQATAAAVRVLATTVNELVDRLAAQRFDAAGMWRVLDALLAAGLAGEFTDYAAAEQATMAAGAILSALSRAGAADSEAVKRYNGALAKAYAATEKDAEYRPERFVEALRGMAALRKK
jgi:hypothetical protein